ncbi:MAG: hypothetical protein H0T97_11010 [Actinobacteria bacterium]|nr:hypothetical protein [Actinomycetota bacterium]
MSTTSYQDCLPATWLASRFAIDPFLIDAMRRDGQLVAVRPPGSTGWLYPGWQFDGRSPRPVIARIMRAARDKGLDESRLYTILTAPLGLGGERRVYELLLEGREDDVVELVRAG